MIVTCGQCGGETEILTDAAGAFRSCPRCNLQAPEREPCKRSTGTYRAHFETRAEAEQFAQDPANHPIYLGDIAHKCGICDWWHLSRPEWLAPAWLDLTAKNAALN
jgi:hypothetical protein